MPLTLGYSPARENIHIHKVGARAHARLASYLLTQWSRVFLETLTGFQLVKNFPAYYGTRCFITTFTSARQLSLSRASSIQSIPPHPTSWKNILILSYHLRLGLPSCLIPSGFPHQASTQLHPVSTVWFSAKRKWEVSFRVTRNYSQFVQFIFMNKSFTFLLIDL